MILAGQGVLYAGATAELVRLAELTGTPVATTLNGKSAFPEDHPLALGTAARTRPATVDRFFAQADLVLGIGTSFTRSLYITPMPAGDARADHRRPPRSRDRLRRRRSAASATRASCCCSCSTRVGEARSERRAATEGAGRRRARRVHAERGCRG